MKKAATTKKKLVKKVEKVCKKSWSKNQSLKMRNLTLKNNISEIGTLKDNFSNSLIEDPNKPIFWKALAVARLKTIKMKKLKSQTFTF